MEAPQQWHGSSARQARTTFLADRAVELGKSTMRTPRPNEEYITTLRKGNYMIKYGRRGQPHQAHFIVSEDLTRLSWTSKKSRSADNRREILFSSVTAVETGQGTQVFKRFPAHEYLKKLSFSIHYVKKGRPRTLDIVCRDAEEYELWFVGLDSVHRGLIQPLRPQRKARGATKRLSTATESDYEGMGHDGNEPLLGSIETTFDDDQPSPRKITPSATAESEKKALAAVSAKKKKKKGHRKPAKDLIGDIYIWGAPSGAVSSGRSALNGGITADGLQESWAPTQVKDTFRLDVASVACGPRHAVLVTKNGETYTWGCGDAGRLGHGDCQSLNQPKMVLDLSGRGVVQMACGDWHSAAITRDGSLYTWGDGTAGILGHGNPHRLWSPKRVERPLQCVIFTFVAAGPYHTAAVSRTGDLYTWGDGFGGKLGHGNHDTYLQPRKVEKLAGHRVTNVATGVWHTACVTVEAAPQPAEQPTEASGASSAGPGKASAEVQRRRRAKPRDRGVVWSWGGGDKGCLGNGDEEGRMEPERIRGGPESVRAVAAGLHFTLLLSAGGKVWLSGTTCASGFDGQKLPPWEGGLSPVRVKGALGGLIATQVAAGMHHVAVVAGPLENPYSQLYTWGRGTEGQLGHGPAVPGSSPSCPEPRLISSLENRCIIQVACGGCNTMAVVEHDAKANLREFNLAAKELDELLPQKSKPPPPAGLMVSHLPSLGQGSGSAAGSGQSAGRVRSRANSVTQSITSNITGRRGPESDCGRPGRASWCGIPGGAGPLALPPSGTLGGTPAIFLCPITKEVFEDPVVAADGYTYERSAIVQWLRTSSKSPMTIMKLDHMSLTTNHAVRSAIEEWRQWKSTREGGRTSRYAHSVGGSSQGSIFSGPQHPPTSHYGGVFHGAVIMANNPLGGTSVRSASTTASTDPLRAISERL